MALTLELFQEHETLQVNIFLTPSLLLEEVDLFDETLGSIRKRQVGTHRTESLLFLRCRPSFYYRRYPTLLKFFVGTRLIQS